MADELTDAQKAEYKVAFDKYADGSTLRAKKLSVVSLCRVGFTGVRSFSLWRCVVGLAQPRVEQ